MDKAVLAFAKALGRHARDVEESNPHRRRWGLKILLPASIETREEELKRLLLSGSLGFDRAFVRHNPRTKKPWLTVAWSCLHPAENLERSAV